jgi:glucose-1-phosphate adenylyltransferase
VIIADGSIIIDAHTDRAVIGIRNVIGSGATIRTSVLMWADFYQAEAWEAKPTFQHSASDAAATLRVPLSTRNARIGKGVVTTPEGKPANADCENYCIRDGVVVIPKGTVISTGTLI